MDNSVMCPSCHGRAIESTCVGYLNPPDENNARCHACGWKGISEHTLTYIEGRSNPEEWLEYLKGYELVDKVPSGAAIGKRFRLKGGCKCGRDLLVSAQCACSCTAFTADKKTRLCDFALMSG